MSKKLISILNDELSSGNLLKIIQNNSCYQDTLPSFGYSKGTTKYIKVIREFCISNNIPAESIFEDKRLKDAYLDRICPVCSCVFKVSKTRTWFQIEAIMTDESEQCFEDDF